ncbi:hypothetical protein DRH29_01990 [candidate division Kazan bacterium]|uniref:Orc1-like AAA ATPase domain-containing protein n=1 Tax=candidate division Kazan bacterium TaxID=2202143 RepID=A0A420ZCZ1_UNCK3|nr:MAG: hypothetical protein DRH29_01990 [candidate division Kazan bacterium]
MIDKNMGEQVEGEDLTSVEDEKESTPSIPERPIGDKIELVETVEDSDRQLFDKEYKGISRERIYDDERFWNDPKYLSMLNKAVFQSIVSYELYEKRKIKKKDIAIIDIDIPDSTVGLEVALEKFEREDITRTPDIKAVEDHIPLLLTVHDSVVDVFYQCGVKGDKFFGDGARGLCEGGVDQAVATANLLKESLSQYGLDVRVGIDVGDVTIIGCGNEKTKKAFLMGDTVKNAEAIQKHARVGDIAMSLEAQKKKRGQAETDLLEWTKYREILIAPDEIRREIKAREAFLPASRVRELRYQYLSGEELSPSVIEVCTLVIDLPDIEDRPFDEANRIITEIFEIITNSGGEIDKTDGRKIMANFLAGRSDFDGVQAGIRLVEILKGLNVPFNIAAARSNALSVVMGGDRTVIGRVANLAYREVVDSPAGVLTIDEDLMRRVETQIKKGESIGVSEYKGIGRRERFVVSELKGWYELARAERLLFRQDELDELSKECGLVEQSGGRCLAIAGRQGFGKSALVAEFLAMKKREGYSTYFGRAEEYTSKQQFAVWRDLFKRIFNLEEMSTEERTEMILGKFPHLSESLALLDPILGTKFERTTLVKSLETRPKDMREMQAEIVVELLSTLSRNSSNAAVVLLEDMQFFDEDSQSLLIEVLYKIKDSNSLLIVTTRPHDLEGTLNLPPEEFGKLENVGKMEIGSVLPVFDDEKWERVKEDWWTAANLCVPLDRTDFEQDGDFFKRMFRKIYEETEGNFRALQTYLRSWTVYGVQKGYFEAKDKVVDGKLQTVYSLVRDKDGNPMRISDENFKKLGDVSGIETRRFHNLELPKVKNILLSASVIGSSFSIDELLYVSGGLNEEEVIGLLGEAERRGFIRHIGGDMYAFANNEISTAIYRTRSEELDPTLQYQHRLLGQYYHTKNPDDLHKIAFHLRHSDDYLAALEVLDKLVRQSKNSFSWETMLNSVNHSSKIFAKIKGGGGEWRAIPPWSNEQFVQSEPQSKLEKDKLISGEINRLLIASITLRRFRRGDIMEPVDLALDEFKNLENKDRELPTKELITWCRILICKACNYDLLKQIDKADEIFEQLFNITNYKFCLGDDSPDATNSALHKMMSDFLYFYGLHLSKKGQYESAIGELEKALEFSTDPIQEARIRNGIGVENMRIGELERAKQEFKTLISLAGQNRDLKKNLNIYWMNLGEVYERFGEFELAMDCFDKSIEAADKVQNVTSRLGTRANQGFVRKFQGRFKDALHIYQEVIQQAGRRGIGELTSLCKSESVFCYFEIGDYTEARRAINKLQGTEFQGRGLTLTAIEKLLLGENDTDLLEDIFLRGSKKMLQAKIDQLHIAFDNYYFGKKLLHLGHRDLGKQHLLQAREYYQRKQVPMLISEIEALLEELV